jgi:hypothetical protein
MALSNIVLLFSTQKEVRCRVFPQILSSDILTAVKLDFSLGANFQRTAYFSEYGIFKSIFTHLTWDVGGTKM